VTVDQNLRVLIVDDDRPFRQMTRAVLEADDRFEIVGEASNGIQALLLVERLEPDAVLVDLDIPALTGIELVRLVGESRPEVRIVVVTGSDDPSDQAAALRWGARKVLTKCAASVASIGDALVAD
jgi:two-component system nitrate/nitrite response regulator NarL